MASELEGFASVLNATGAASLALFLVRPSHGRMDRVVGLGEPLPTDIPSAFAGATSFTSGLQALAVPIPLWLQTVPIMEDGHQAGAVVLTYTQRCKPTFSPTFIRLVSALVAAVWENRTLRKEMHDRELQPGSTREGEGRRSAT